MYQSGKHSLKLTASLALKVGLEAENFIVWAFWPIFRGLCCKYQAHKMNVKSNNLITPKKFNMQTWCVIFNTQRFQVEMHKCRYEDVLWIPTLWP